MARSSSLVSLLLTGDGKIVLAGETNAGSIQDFDFALSRYLNQ